jgi:serine/threonine/tyrosine-interacting protein
MDKIATGLFYISHKALRYVNMSNIMYHSDSPIDQILDNIYLGDFRAADDISILRDNGITHIINCAKDIPEVFPTDFEYLSLNLKDTPNEDLIEAISDSMNFMKNAKKVFIHCKQGVSRSASIVLAYLIKYENMKYDTALSFLQMKRFCVNPNLGFESQLRKFEEICNCVNCK